VIAAAVGRSGAAGVATSGGAPEQPTTTASAMTSAFFMAREVS
jgi:hypothetical protein